MLPGETLQVRRLEKIIANRNALSIDQLDIEAGQIVAVVGQIGSGKTLLVRILAGTIVPSGGTVTLAGQDIHRVPAARSRIGSLFEEDLLYDRLSARRNLDFYRRLHKLPVSAIDDALASVGISDQANTAVAKLTPTVRRRLAFARSLMAHPSVLLLDLPTLHTDFDTQTLFARLIAQAAAENIAVLLTVEDLAWAGKFCTHVIELEDGRITGSRCNTTDTSSDNPVEPERLIPYKVPARKEDRIMLFDPGDILYATSRDGKTILHTSNEEATTNLTLQELESRLVGRGFFKAHRAYLVNLQHIHAVIQYTRNSYTLLLNDTDETMIPLSKQSEKELQMLLGY
jgi:ABC-2 type transport system ATP-binding protein